MVAPSRMLEKVEEAACLTIWEKVEVDEAGRIVLYMRSKRRVSKISRTMSMIGDEGGGEPEVGVWDLVQERASSAGGLQIVATI